MLLKTIVFGFRVRWAKATPFVNAARRVAVEGWRVGKAGLLGLRERLLKMREVLGVHAGRTMVAGKDRLALWRDAIGPAMQRWKEGLGPAWVQCREGFALSMINWRRVLGVALHDSKAFVVVWSVRTRLFLSEASASFPAASARHFQRSRLLAAQAATLSVTLVVRLRTLKPREILTSAIHNTRVVFLTVSHFSQPLLLKSRVLLTQKYHFLASSAETLKTHILSALETVGKQAKQLLPQHRRTRRPKTDSMHVILMGYLTDRTLEQERPATGARPMTAPEIT